MAGSIYKQAIPLANACRKPGEWQYYDIAWTAPRFKSDGTLESPAYVTVIFNGVLVQNHFELKGETAYIGKPKYKPYDTAPINAPGPWRWQRAYQLPEYLDSGSEADAGRNDWQMSLPRCVGCHPKRSE